MIKPTPAKCPSCGRNFWAPNGDGPAVCPGCQRKVVPPRGSTAPRSSTAAPPAARVPPPPPPPPAVPPPVPARMRFLPYLAAHYAATRSSAVLGICLGLLATPVISFCKPLLGFRGQCCVPLVRWPSFVPPDSST